MPLERVQLCLHPLPASNACTHSLLRIDISDAGVRYAPTTAAVSVNLCRRQANDYGQRGAPDTVCPLRRAHGTLDLLAAVFLYTLEKPNPIYSCITVPLNVSGKRTLQSLQQLLPYMKLFTFSLRCLPPPASSYHFKGAVIARSNAASISTGAAFKAKYEAHSSAYQVGTFDEYTRVCCAHLLQHKQSSGGRVRFVWPDGHGVKMHDLSAFEDKGEVLLERPSVCAQPQ